MADKIKSERAMLADRVALLVKTSKLNDPFGGTVNKGEDNKRVFYYVGFSDKNKSLDGQVNIYAENFIQVDYTSQGKSEKPVFTSESDFFKFFGAFFVRGDLKGAEKVPRKPEKK